MKKYIIGSILLLTTLTSFAQKKFSGMIMDKNLPKGQKGMEGVNVHWLNTSIGTVTNAKGKFEIPYKSEYKKLVISFIGYKTDTITVKNIKPIHHFLTEENTLDEVVVSAEKEATTQSFLKTQNFFTVNSGELLKAACCNLAESFETNPSIDVNFSDALTGTRQIRMLGLNSPYLLITQENVPMVRGASQVYGMTFIPGTWVESIQISKGAGSVVNGYESISGQINAELVKPNTDNTFFVNAFGNLNGRMELNSHINQKLNDKWSTGLYVHGNHRVTKFDKNNDGFLDNPLAEQINIMNRWQYANPKTGWVTFLNLRYMNDKKQTGQTNFNPATDKGSSSVWGSEINTKRFDSSAKIGYVFPDMPFQSIGLQLSYSNHDQNSYFGLRDYNIRQQSVYSNIIFASIIGDTRHKFKTGATFMYDNYDENVESLNFDRRESNIGAFFEYAHDNGEDFSATAGVRVDYHSLLGTFVTPRLHLRYEVWERGVLRASVGSGKRSTSVFAENQQLFASSRKIKIKKSGGEIYGLNPEKAWNYGVSLLQGFKVFRRKANISVDFYQTNFENQIVVDWENPQEVSFYNLDGKSIANSLQIETNISPVKYFNIRAAYKYLDVTTDYTSGKLSKPLQAKHRFFTSVSYETPKKTNGAKWKFDTTYNFMGKQRLPNTNNQLANFSKGYNLLNAQITKVFSDKLEIYAGGENLTDYKQKNPILGAENPFGTNFDSTIIYAPIFGRGFYAGMRLKIK